MSLLVPDYSSSSEDEDAPGTSTASVAVPALVPAPAAAKVPAPTSVVSSESAPKSQQKKPKKKAKKKTTLYLPPEIQRLLETGGGALSDDSDDDNELLAKHKRAKKAAGKRLRQTPDQSKDSVLSFLPPPKHEFPVAAGGVEPVDAAHTGIQEQTQRVDVDADATPAVVQQTEAEATAWQQYYYQQQQYEAAQSEASYYGQGEEDVAGGSSKRKRTRERDIERALQQGNLESVAGQLTDVQGPCPTAWQPPSESLSSARSAGGSGDQEVKVQASFWNTQAGGKVASTKPSRLQRQKHQLNQLAFDAKLRDFELLDKRGTAMKTKRETYAKYGW